MSPRTGLDQKCIPFAARLMKEPKILIIGAGIGGLTAAIALRQAGFATDVFERAAELREVGAGIALSPNAMRALNYLGVMESVVERSTVLDAVTSYTSRGTIIGSLSTKQTDLPSVSLHRAELQRVLASALPSDCVHPGEELVSIENSDSEVTAYFASGHSVSGDVLIGADGLRSRARAQLIGDGKPIYRGYQCWRGVCPHPPGSVLTETFGLGVRVGVVPIGPRGTAWWCTANEAESASDDPEGAKVKLLRWLGNWHQPIPAVIAATDPAAIIKTAIYDRASVKKWSNGRCTLLGDAAHPTTPNMGQGGCMAIEDAIVLTRCLSHYGDPAAAFQAYERLRYPRTTTVTRISRHYGSIGQWERPLAGWFRETLLRLGSGKGATKGYLKFVNYDSTKVVR
jgi:2-polyprenyl-6-methoxyphenol hydroxylase-like FAD-dependent oxidoreductase